MPKGFRPLLEPSTHPRGNQTRRPCLCVAITLGTSLLVLTIFGISAWNVLHNRFGINSHHFQPDDEVSLWEVSDDFSSTFCDKYQLTLWTPSEVYLLRHRARVNTTIADRTPVSMRQLPHRAFNVRTAYLLRGSIIDVTACRESGSEWRWPAKIIVIRGPENFRKWRRDSNCHSCVVEHVDIPSNAICDSTDTTKSNHPRRTARLIHQVKRDAIFFIVISGGGVPPRPLRTGERPPMGIYLNGAFMRTRFDLHDTESKCHVMEIGAYCTLDLPWHSDKDIVVKFQKSDHEFGHFSEVMDTKCHIRVAFWIFVFTIPPILFIFPIATLLGCILCRSAPKSSHKTIEYGATESRPKINKNCKSDRVAPTKMAGGETNRDLLIQHKN